MTSNNATRSCPACLMTSNNYHAMGVLPSTQPVANICSSFILSSFDLACTCWVGRSYCFWHLVVVLTMRLRKHRNKSRVRSELNVVGRKVQHGAAWHAAVCSGAKTLACWLAGLWHGMVHVCVTAENMSMREVVWRRCFCNAYASERGRQRAALSRLLSNVLNRQRAALSCC